MAEQEDVKDTVNVVDMDDASTEVEKDNPLKQEIIAALKTIFDPEIPVNIYDLGLIYRVDVAESGFVDIKMTLTTPACPVAQTFPGNVQDQVGQVEGVENVVVELVWDPPWTPECMSDEARMTMGMYNI